MAWVLIAIGVLTFLIEIDMRKINKRFKEIEDRIKVLEEFRVEQEERNFRNNMIGGF